MMFMTILFSAPCADLDRSNAITCVWGAFSFSRPQNRSNSPLASLCCPEPVYRASLILRMGSPLFVISLVTCLNFPAAYMVSTFHVGPTDFKSRPGEKDGCQLGGFRITPAFNTSLHIRPRRRLLDLFRGPSSARAVMFCFLLSAFLLCFWGEGAGLSPSLPPLSGLRTGAGVKPVADFTGYYITGLGWLTRSENPAVVGVSTHVESCS